MIKISAAITAVGGYVPDFILTNKILETMVDTNDEWITSRTAYRLDCYQNISGPHSERQKKYDLLRIQPRHLALAILYRCFLALSTVFVIS